MSRRKNSLVAYLLTVGVVFGLIGGCGSEGEPAPSLVPDAGHLSADAASEITPSTSFEWDVSPLAIDFLQVEIGEEDLQLVGITNHSAVARGITDLLLVDTDPTLVRFTTDFIRSLNRPTTAWRDLDGDGQGFEETGSPVVVDPGETFEIELQFAPDGGVDECLDREPAPCGALVVTCDVGALSVPMFVPR